MTNDAERIARLERQVEALLAKVEEQAARIAVLEAENAKLRRRLDENSRNSNKPPSSDAPQQRSDRPKAPPTGRGPGGQPGHKGKRRELLPSSKVTSSTECFPDNCRRCSADLLREVDSSPIRHQIVEIPEVTPDVHEFRLHRVTCSCGVTTCAALPAGTPAGMFGSRLLALIAVLTGSMHVSRRKVQLLLRDLLGIEVSLGCLSESEQVVSDAVAPAVDEARVHSLAANVKHVDATTWYEAGEYRSLWVLATKAVSVLSPHVRGWIRAHAFGVRGAIRLAPVIPSAISRDTVEACDRCEPIDRSPQDAGWVTPISIRPANQAVRLAKLVARRVDAVPRRLWRTRCTNPVFRAA